MLTFTDAQGYLRTHKGNKHVHVLVAEATLGRPLPDGAVVHHVDEDKHNNAPSNLVICQDQAYHLLLHARARIVDAGGSPELHRICQRCEQLLPKTAFSTAAKHWDGRAGACRKCTNERRRGKGYTKWTPRRAEQQRARRARAAAC